MSRRSAPQSRPPHWPHARGGRRRQSGPQCGPAAGKNQRVRGEPQRGRRQPSPPAPSGRRRRIVRIYSLPHSQPRRCPVQGQRGAGAAVRRGRQRPGPKPLASGAQRRALRSRAALTVSIARAVEPGSGTAGNKCRRSRGASKRGGWCNTTVQWGLLVQYIAVAGAVWTLPLGGGTAGSVLMPGPVASRWLDTFAAVYAQRCWMLSAGANVAHRYVQSCFTQTTKCRMAARRAP